MWDVVRKGGIVGWVLGRGYIELSLGDFEVGLGDDLVQGVGATAEELAGVAVAGWGRSISIL